MDIRYKVEFFTDWHCGSGLGAGADVDALVIKDPEGLPFLPGKTVKGLLREAAEDLISFRGEEGDEEIVKEIFGFSPEENDKDSMRGVAYFTNATLSDREKGAIVAEGLQPYLYRTLSSTAIDEDGIAIDHSLRRMEVAVPCILEGRILNLPDREDCRKLITDAFRFIKRLGQNRNRGLGRCSFTIMPTEK